MRKLLITLSITALALAASAIMIARRPSIPPSKRAPNAILFFPSVKTPATDAKNLRVMTYNIGYASGDKNNVGDVLTRAEVLGNLETMAKTLVSLRPDILALQEVDFKAARSFDIDQLGYLAKALDMPYAAYATTWNLRYLPWPYWPPSLHFGRIVSGQAVLSRYPIRSQTLHRFHKPESNPFWYNWFYLERLAQHLTVDVDGRATSVWHIHFEAFDPAARKLQAERLAELVNADPAADKIVLGDFNSVSQTRADVLASDPVRYEENGEL